MVSNFPPFYSFLYPPTFPPLSLPLFLTSLLMTLFPPPLYPPSHIVTLMLCHVPPSLAALAAQQGSVLSAEKASSNFRLHPLLLCLSWGNGCKHECQWGGGILLSIIRIKAHTLTLTISFTVASKTTLYSQTLLSKGIESDAYTLAGGDNIAKDHYMNIYSSVFQHYWIPTQKRLIPESDAFECLCNTEMWETSKIYFVWEA